MKTILHLAASVCILLGLTSCNPKSIQELNISYGEVSGQKLLMDVYRPATKTTEPQPGVILIHGGGWSEGDKDEYNDQAQFLAQQGYVVFNINYRLVKPEADYWPAQLDDTQRAVRWIRAHAKEYGVDPQHLAAMGGSAGGHLVACLGVMDTRDNSDQALAAYSSRPTCIVMMCAPTDLTDDFAPKVTDGAWTNEVMRALQGHPEDYKTAASAASPLFFVNKQSAPALIFQGKTDPIIPLDQAERFAAALKKEGVEADLIVYGGGHGIDDPKSLEQFITKTTKFLKKHLRP